MNLFRMIALFALVGAVPLAARATPLGSNPVAAASAPSFGPATPESSTWQASGAGSGSADAVAIFAASPVPVGDTRWSYRAFAVTAEGLQQPEQVEAVQDPPSPTPEPAGLFLLGTGAFITALSIRYRLFAL